MMLAAVMMIPEEKFVTQVGQYLATIKPVTETALEHVSSRHLMENAVVETAVSAINADVEFVSL